MLPRQSDLFVRQRPFDEPQFDIILLSFELSKQSGDENQAENENSSVRGSTDEICFDDEAALKHGIRAIVAIRDISKRPAANPASHRSQTRAVAVHSANAVYAKRKKLIFSLGAVGAVSLKIFFIIIAVAQRRT